MIWSCLFRSYSTPTPSPIMSWEYVYCSIFERFLSWWPYTVGCDFMSQTRMLYGCADFDGHCFRKFMFCQLSRISLTNMISYRRTYYWYRLLLSISILCDHSISTFITLQGSGCIPNIRCQGRLCVIVSHKLLLYWPAVVARTREMAIRMNAQNSA